MITCLSFCVSSVGEVAVEIGWEVVRCTKQRLVFAVVVDSQVVAVAIPDPWQHCQSALAPRHPMKAL